MAVGPGVPGTILLGPSAGLFSVNPLPVTGAKIHRPLLRADVLSRERLNGWLDRAATGRLALIIAEAGFGKTTLLGDWARHTARLTAWYRLESDDRDWLTFIRHLVASGRELDPEFGPETYALLRQLGPGGPTQAAIVASLVRELSEFAAAHGQGLTLIFDDYHVIDGCDETGPIVSAILERTGPGFSVVIAARSAPKLPLGRLRARGGVARLDGAALCFDVPEADRLFRDAYHQPLEPDVVTSLIDRTEGWPALLSLVRTNLEGEDATEIRRLVSGLSGAAGDTYDFLAEEVIDRLPADVATFLMRTSILDELDIELGAVVAQQAEATVASWLATAEAFSLISRRDASTAYRVLPIARELLLARYQSVVGRDGIQAAHLAIGRHFEAHRWRVAAIHYERAGETERAALVIERSLDQILGAGQYRAAADLLAASAEGGVVQRVLHSRLLLQVGATKEAMSSAVAAIRLAGEEDGHHASLALQNAASIAIGARDYDGAADYARRAGLLAVNHVVRDLSDAYEGLIGAARDLSLPALVLRLEGLLSSQLRNRQWHYAAITSLNLAQILVWLDRSDDALRLAGEAELLLRRSSQGYEAVSVRLAQAHALAQLGRWSDAERLLLASLDTAHPDGHSEAVLEAAAVAAWYGPYGLASQILARASRDALPEAWAHHWRILDLWIDGVECDHEVRDRLPVEPTSTMEVGAAFRWHLAMARSHLLSKELGDFPSSLARADETAAAQKSPVQQRLTSVLRTIGDGAGAISTLLATWPSSDDPIVSVFAPEIAGALGELSDAAVSTVARAARSLPHRWLAPLRSKLTDADVQGAARAATIIEEVGEAEDIPRLRAFSRRSRRSGAVWGNALIERLAPRVLVEDLGLITIQVGTRSVDGRGVRRKVLALLAFLASQPRGAATPDQILDALWPDLDPEQGMNSLHQTIYFLRRVLDPAYKTGFSPEYIHYDTEVVWLDLVLLDCRSWQVRRLLAQRQDTQAVVESLINLYRGQFAADFAYEDWAAAYRDGLHANYLSVIERAVAGAIGASSARWRLWVGQQCLAVDQHADAVEARVIRLYGEIGAPAAAAEQYTHYSTTLRDQLGVEPPLLADLLGDVQ